MLTGRYQIHSYACPWKKGAAHVSADTEGESGSSMSMEQINGKQLTIRRPVDGTHHLLKCMSENWVSLRAFNFHRGNDDLPVDEMGYPIFRQAQVYIVFLFLRHT